MGERARGHVVNSLDYQAWDPGLHLRDNGKFP